ncbi:MAG: tripartite tricarboxylate transporter family receptor [Hyphomicrobiales bacterium]|nr:tripartite tricarboxylate transporter family receptor [Hyphomicrobiales bacterium]
MMKSGIVLLAVAMSAPACAEPVADFYRGKTITMLVASGVGGGYDTYARVFARHAVKFIPGNPNIVAKNMPAAGGLAAASTLYNNADKDALTIAALSNVSTLDPLFGNPGARYDPRRFGWIGSIGKLQNVCATWHTSPVKTIQDARQRSVIVAGAGASSNTAVVPRIVNELLGTRFKVVAGYDPAGGLTMAVENGEAEGICGLSWSTMKASRPDWIAGRKLNVILQVSMEKLPELKDVPSALDLVTDPARKRVLELILIRQETGRPFVTSPGSPPDRLAALRAAFDATMKDPEFLADAERNQMEIEPLTGAGIDAFLAKAYASPADVVAQAAALVGPAAEAKQP